MVYLPNYLKRIPRVLPPKIVEDFVSLTRVYFQSVIAANLGITNIRFVPDVANFKRLFKYRLRADDWDKPKRLLHAKC